MTKTIKIVCPICDGAGIDLDYYLLLGRESACLNCYGTGYEEYPEEVLAKMHPSEDTPAEKTKKL